VDGSLVMFWWCTPNSVHLNQKIHPSFGSQSQIIWMFFLEADLVDPSEIVIDNSSFQRWWSENTWQVPKICMEKRGCQIPHRCLLKISQTLPLAGMLHFNVLQITDHAVWRFSLLPIKGLWWIMLLPSHNFLGSLADNTYLIKISTLATRHNFSQFPTSTKCFRCSSPSAC